VTLNYTYNDGRDISNGGNKPLSDLPFHTANGTVDWKATQDWSFYVQGNYTGEKRADQRQRRVAMLSGIPARRGRRRKA
jgi:outer membrane receptor for ferrienterochelin and colicins